MSHLSDQTVQAFADGVLEPDAQAQAELHLQTCAACQGLLADYRALFSGLEDLPVPVPPLHFTSRVMGQIAEGDAQLARSRRLAGFMLAGSAIVSLACLALAGNGAWADQLTSLNANALALGRLGQAWFQVLAPVLAAVRTPLLAGVGAVCVPIFLALHRAIAPRRQAV